MTLQYEPVVVLLNGAGCEVGKVSALQFAADGAHVILCDQESDMLASIVQSIHDQGGQATVYFTDVTSPLEVAQMVNQIREEHGSIDILVNNLTNHVKRASKEQSFEYYTQFFEDLLDSVANVTSEVLPLMRARNYGRIIQVLPGVIHVGENGFPAYAAAQSAIHKITYETAMQESSSGHNIVASILNPGVILTELNPFFGEEPSSILPLLRTLATLPSGAPTGRMHTANIMDHQGQIYEDQLFDDEEVDYMNEET
ncbi:SDR family NAD(P)-dependent oxidoreductase [Paenibacillus sp. GCM10023252]|uniref:SDR family NAD(P)-dependent oxidoreductase n=1 Tax=Paenibacillus sp. GCM10023252 TaxID=3252649 RepID=UPI003615C3CB